MYQKLTYSGTSCKSYLYFCFRGEHFDIESMNEILGIAPTSFKMKAIPAPIKASWQFRIDIGTEVDFEIYLERLIDVFSTRIKAINHLKSLFSLDTILMFVIDIDIKPEASTPFFSLNKRAIDFLYRTGTEVVYDLYKVDSIGLLGE